MSEATVNETYSIICIRDGKPTGLETGDDISSLCMFLLKQGHTDAAEKLSKLSCWSSDDFIALNKPKAFVKRDCSCPYLWNGWWFTSTVERGGGE